MPPMDPHRHMPRSSRLLLLLLSLVAAVVAQGPVIVDAVGPPLSFWLEIFNKSDAIPGVRVISDPTMSSPDADPEDTADAIASAVRTSVDPRVLLVSGPATAAHARAFGATLKSQASDAVVLALSTETLLLDRRKYPNVQPMIPNHDAEAVFVAELARRFHWTQLSVLYSQEAETQSLVVSLLDVGGRSGVSVLPFTFERATDGGLQQALQRVKLAGAYIVAVAVVEADLVPTLAACVRLGLAESPWQLLLLTPSSRRPDLMYDPSIAHAAEGMLAVQTWVENATRVDEARTMWSEWRASELALRPFLPPADALPPPVMSVFFSLYHSAWVLARASADAHNLTAAFVRDYLYTHVVDTAVGPMSFDAASGAMNPLFTAVRLGETLADARPVLEFADGALRELQPMVWRGSGQSTAVPPDRYRIASGSRLDWEFGTEDVVLAVALGTAISFVGTIMTETMLQSRADGRRWWRWMAAIAVLESMGTWCACLLAVLSVRPMEGRLRCMSTFIRKTWLRASWPRSELEALFCMTSTLGHR